MAAAEGNLRLLDQPGEPLGAYLRYALTQAGLLGDGSGGLVLPRLTGETVCQVYSGVCTKEVSGQVLECLLAGRRVWCPWEGLSDFGTGPLARRVRERLEALRRSGLILCPLGQLAQMAARGAGRGRGYGAGTGGRVGVVYPKGR